MKDQSVEERFWAKVNKTETCWLWTGAKHEKGYGLLKVARIFAEGSEGLYARAPLTSEGGSHAKGD
jgi:hypothetical protein